MNAMPNEPASFSGESATCLKGFFSLCVLWHHISQKSMRFYATNLGTIFQMMGYLSVAVFFFISGYGLMKSAAGGDTQYIDRFPKSRLLTFYADVSIFTVIYIIANLVMFGMVDRVLIVKTLTYGGTIISNGWYFQVALILYIVFYISFKITQNDDKALFICTAMVLVFCVLNFGFKQSQTLYESVLAFPMGMLFVFNDNLSKKMTSVRAVMPAAMFFIITVVGEYLMRGSPMGIICKMISALTFVICVLCFHSFVSRTKVKKLMTDPMLKWLGNRSFEIYARYMLFKDYSRILLKI